MEGKTKTKCYKNYVFTSKSKKTCRYCKKSGHLSEERFLRKKNNEPIRLELEPTKPNSIPEKKSKFIHFCHKIKVVKVILTREQTLKKPSLNQKTKIK